MKKLMYLLAIVLFVGQATAQTTEYLQQKDFKVEKQKIYEGINASRKQLNEIKKGEITMVESIDSLKKIIDMNTGRLLITTDSLSNTREKLNMLQERIDNSKVMSRAESMMAMVILLLLFAIVFLLLYLFRRKAELNHQSMVELDKQTNERMDTEINHLKSDLNANRDVMNKLSAELNQKIVNGFISFEAQNQKLEEEFKKDLAEIEGKTSTFSTEISKLREDQIQAVKGLEDKLHTLKQEADLNYQGVISQTARLEEELKRFKGKP